MIGGSHAVIEPTDKRAFIFYLSALIVERPGSFITVADKLAFVTGFAVGIKCLPVAVIHLHQKLSLIEFYALVVPERSLAA